MNLLPRHLYKISGNWIRKHSEYEIWIRQIFDANQDAFKKFAATAVDPYKFQHNESIRNDDVHVDVHVSMLTWVFLSNNAGLT